LIVVFKKLLGALGVGGPGVDTVLASSQVRPGAGLSGKVIVQGGSHDAVIDFVTLSLVTTIEIETDDREHAVPVEFFRVPVSGSFPLAAGQQQVIPFDFAVPIESPLTHIGGRSLSRMAVGLRTELAVAKAVDRTDLDPIMVEPLPAQLAVINALHDLGFRHVRADLERGRIRGIAQTLPFYQELEYRPPHSFAHWMTELEITFVADSRAVTVILEVDKRGGVFTAGRDVFYRGQVPLVGHEQTDWKTEVSRWLADMAR
jgi:sporulation-control protein